jgi:predicted aspartyl protease
MSKILFAILFYFFTPACFSQEILSKPVSKFITKFPFKQYSGGVMVLQAKFENVKDSLNFILDTGSGGISLDSATCAEFNIPITKTDTTITGIGGTKKVAFVFNKTLHLPGLDVKDLNFHINDYSVLSSVYGEKIDGVIGYSFFNRYIVAINFDSLQMEVFTPGKFDYPGKGTILTPIFTALPIQWATLKDKKKISFNYYLDTGAGLCLLLSDKFVKDSSILLSRRKPVITQAEGMAGKLQIKLTVVKQLKIGPYRFRNVPTYIYHDEYNVTNYPYTGGLIGNDLLRRFNLVINYPAKEIHLMPNNNFNEVFDYAYTGLGIYYVNGKIIVEDVIKNSPAEIAGFLVDDEVVGIDNNLSYNIQAYKTLLQTPNQIFKVLVRRKGALILLIIHTQSIR